MRIREAHHEDAKTIVDFQIRLAFETEGLQLTHDTVQKGVAAVFDDSTKGYYLVAEENGLIAACLLVVPEWSDWRNSTVLWIHSLYVVAEHRHVGVFRAMYQHLRNKVENRRGYAGIRLYVDKRNTVAIKAYENMGMSSEHYAMFEWVP